MSEKINSNQNVTVIAGLASGIANWATPALAELVAFTNVSTAVNWNSFAINIQASPQQDDRTLTDAAGAQSRGLTQFGGSIELVNPKVDDTSSIYRTAYNIFSTPRVELAVAVRYGKKNSLAPAAGDRWYVYHVIVDATSFGKNDVSHYYRVNLKPRDDIAPNYIVPPSSPVAITQTIIDNTVVVGDLVFAKAVYQGWDITKAATWVSSDSTKLELVHPGIFRSLATGTPTISAKYPGATDSTPGTVTIS